MTCVFKLILAHPDKVLDVILGPEEQIAYVTVTRALRRLVTIPISHFCEKARWALDRAGLAYVEERARPGPAPARRAASGRRPRVPVLVTDEGVFAAVGVDHPLRRRAPAAGAAPVHRRPEVVELCRWLDAGLGPDGRRLIYKHMLPRKRLMLPVQQPGRAGVGSARAERALPGRHALGDARAAALTSTRRRPARASPRSTRSPSGSPTAAATCSATASPPPT